MDLGARRSSASPSTLHSVGLSSPGHSPHPHHSHELDFIAHQLEKGHPTSRDHDPDDDDERRCLTQRPEDEECRRTFTTVEERQEDDMARRKLSRAIFVCLAFFFVELAGGFWAGSLAVLSDSFHLLSDVLSLFLSLTTIAYA
ncbi:hypothetical protein HK101_006763, partial [Irineochytrium annulatum]